MAMTRAARRFGLGMLALCVGCGAALTVVVRSPHRPVSPPGVVDDVTQLNPIEVARVIEPTTVDDVIDALRRHDGPVSIGGARHSMGGQIASPGALFIDMRRLDRVIRFSPEARTITVQAGATWRQIQELIDSANLSVAVMQSYANFTVGGSLSVNAHGRYVGRGPVVSAVRSITIVLADGSVVAASRTVNPDVFAGAIGGYGGLGVIVDATLELVPNTRVRRLDRVVEARNYPGHFRDDVLPSKAVFHNADLYPPDFEAAHAVTFVETDAPPTDASRLAPTQSYWANRLAYWVISEWPMGYAIRRYLLDRWLFMGEPVIWRNREASYDADELEPASRRTSTYVLQEYFVPVARFHTFAARMRDVFQRRRVNAVNVSVRHARADEVTILSWARTDVFAFVVYYKQGTDTRDRLAVRDWTRELIDAALAEGGSFYLPYQIHATDAQFRKAYPNAPSFFALKARLDPRNRFRNSLWDAYYRPVEAGDVAAALAR